MICSVFHLFFVLKKSGRGRFSFWEEGGRGGSRKGKFLFFLHLFSSCYSLNFSRFSIFSFRRGQTQIPNCFWCWSGGGGGGEGWYQLPPLQTQTPLSSKPVSDAACRDPCPRDSAEEMFAGERGPHIFWVFPPFWAPRPSPMFFCVCFAFFFVFLKIFSCVFHFQYFWRG